MTSSPVSGGPVRAGDVFRYTETRLATVMEVLPGGRALIRICGTRFGKPSLTVGDAQVRAIKTWERVGRAEYHEGSYLPLDHSKFAAREGATP